MSSQSKKLNIMTKITPLAFFLTNISYLPYFTTSGRTQLLSYPAWLIVLAGMVFSKCLYLKRESLKYFGVIFLFFAIITINTVIWPNDYFGSELIRAVEVSVFIFMIGQMLGFSTIISGNENSLFWAYLLGTLVVDIVVFMTYLRGANLLSSIYAYTSKNELAFLNAASLAILLFSDITQGKRKSTIKNAILMIVYIVMIALMRCRSMLVCVPIFLAVFMLCSNASKKIKGIIVAAALLFAIALNNDQFYNTFVNGILYAGRNASSFDDLSSGRLTQMTFGWNKFQENIFSGTGDTRTIDFFFVSVLMQFGVLAGPVLTIAAFYPLIWGIKKRESNNNLYMVMIMVAVAYLIGAFFEEQAPFGPGVRCYILWFLFGYLQGQKGIYYGENEY